MGHLSLMPPRPKKTLRTGVSGVVPRPDNINHTRVQIGLRNDGLTASTLLQLVMVNV